MNQAKQNPDSIKDHEPIKNPWSIKGIKPNNREAAKQIAGENGLTIGEWINNLIEEADNKSDSEKALMLALDNQPLNPPAPEAPINEISEIFAETASDIQDGNQQIDAAILPENILSDEIPSPLSNRVDDMNQPEPIGIDYNDAPNSNPLSNETSRLALAMEMLNRKLETVAQPTAFVHPTTLPPNAVPFVPPQAAPIAHNSNAHNINAYAPIPLAQAPIAPAPMLSTDRNIENLMRRVEDGEARYERKNERLANTLEDLKEAQTNINEKLRRLEGSENNQRTIHSLQALETSLDSIMRQLSDTNLRTTRIEQELVSEKSNRLTPADVEKILEKSVDEINATMNSELGKVNERLNSVEEYNTKAAEHTEKTNASMRDALVELSARLVNLEGVDTDQMRLDIENRISSLIGRIGEIEENIETLVAKTQAEANEKYATIIHELNERIDASEKGTIGAIENIGNKLISTAETMDQRIREIEEINDNARDSQVAMRMEIGKLSNAIDERLNELESNSSVVVNKANAHLNTIAEQLNSRLSIFESRNRELEDRIKKQESNIDDRFESAHEDISELVRKHGEQSGKQIEEKLNTFETRITAAQEMAQSITKPLHETLIDLMDRLENMEIGNKAAHYNNGAAEPENYSYHLNPIATPADVKLEILHEPEEEAQAETLLHETPVTHIADEHIDAVSAPENIVHENNVPEHLASEVLIEEVPEHTPEVAAEDDPFGEIGFAAPEGHVADEETSHTEFVQVPEYEVPEYSVPEYSLSEINHDESRHAEASPALNEPLLNEPGAKAEVHQEETHEVGFTIPSENLLHVENNPVANEDEEFNLFNEPHIEENDFLHHEDTDFNSDVSLDKHQDLSALSEFEGDFNPEKQELLQSKTYEFDREINNDAQDLAPARKPFGADYLEQARNAALAAADTKNQKADKVKKKSLGGFSLAGSKPEKKQKPQKLDNLQPISDKATGEHKQLVSPIGVALAGVLVASGAYAGYNYLQQQQVAKSSTELPASIQNHEPVTTGAPNNPVVAAPVATIPAAETAKPPVSGNETKGDVKATEKTPDKAPDKAPEKAPEKSLAPIVEKPATLTSAKAPEAKKVAVNNVPAIASATAAQAPAKTVYGQAAALEQAGNFKAAADLYTKAAAAGDARAMNKLSKMFERGQGVPKDMVKAKALTEKAAAAGSRQAQHNLGVYYADGEGGDRNYAKAAENFRKAAKRGMTDSQYNLGAMAERGIGMDKSPKEAYYWYSLAAKSGDSDAKSHAQDAASKLSATDKAETERRINTFRPEQGGYE